MNKFEIWFVWIRDWAVSIIFVIEKEKFEY